MGTLFIKIDQTVKLDQTQAKRHLDGQTGKEISVQFRFAVPSGSIGIEVSPESFVEGGVELIESAGEMSAKLTGLAKVKVFEMQETQIAKQTPLYIEGVVAAGTYTLVPAIPDAAASAVKHDGQMYPRASILLGSKKSALVGYGG